MQCLALIYLAALVMVTGVELPEPNPRFFIFGAIGGLAQILATFLLVHLFSYRNFAVGNAYSKTETVQQRWSVLSYSATQLQLASVSLSVFL